MACTADALGLFFTFSDPVAPVPAMSCCVLPHARRRLLSCLLVLPVLSSLSACGGGDEDYFDTLRPRNATVVDIADQIFTFTGFQYGAVFDASLSSTTTVLSLGAGQASGGSSYQLPFSLMAHGASVNGTATLDEAAQTLTLSFNTSSPALPFAAGTVLTLRIRADVDDGRISLTNLATGVEQTSAPR